jgi:hypothetical protein
MDAQVGWIEDVIRAFIMRDRIQTSRRKICPLLWASLVLCAATAVIMAWPAKRADEALEIRCRALTGSISGGQREINASLVEAATLGPGQRQELIDDLLRFAVINGNRASIDALLQAGANVNARGPRQLTALILTVVPRDGEEIAEQLLAAGADVNASDVDGRTAVMDAAEAGRGGLVGILVAAGADTLAVDHRGRSSLDLARSARESQRKR